jgi:ABC-2 type transport system ATP-binding protein
MFASTLTVRTLAPLAEPGPLFGGLPALESWRVDADGTYQLSVSDVNIAAPAVTRALAASGADVLSIGESQHSLEDVYVQLIGDDERADE